MKLIDIVESDTMTSRKVRDWFRSVLLQRRFMLVMFLQLGLVVMGYAIAFLLRFDFDVPPEQTELLLSTLPLLIVCRLAGYYLYHLNSGWWQYVSTIELVNITKAITVGTLLFLIGLVAVYNVQGFPRSVVIMEAVLNFMLVGGARFGVRLFCESLVKKEAKKLRYALIVGAGEAGVQLLHEISIKPQAGIRVVGFVDDDPLKKNAYIRGVEVLGNTQALPKLIKEKQVDEVIIAIPSVGFKKIAALTEVIRNCGINAKVLPSLMELIENGRLWGQLREVPSDELLARPLVKFRRETDLNLLRNEITGKSVLITGAAGSIGSELTCQTAGFKPARLIIFERNESELYFLELKLREAFPDCNIIPVIGDILNRQKLEEIIQKNQVDLIYHAAAYKHVPIMQRAPVEAVRNNIQTTKIIAELAVGYKVGKLVYISTDKAVNPSSIMGASKRIGEMIMQTHSGNGTKFVTVRFGNVIGSNGSAIPIFKKQIERGGPVTITHPEASRYFMAVSEAVQLVMTAGTMAKGGEIFLLDMGEPIKIVDLAERLIKSSGLTPGKDIDIKFIGLRPGEKLHEELYWQGENILPTPNKKITMLQRNGLDKESFNNNLQRLFDAVEMRNHSSVMEALEQMIPENTFGKNGRINGRNGNGNGNNDHNDDYLYPNGGVAKTFTDKETVSYAN